VAELTPVSVDFEVDGCTVKEIHEAAYDRLLRLIDGSPAVESVGFTFGALKPIDDYTWTAEVAATILYDEDKVTNDDSN
jgi:hypothetical protein